MSSLKFLLNNSIRYYSKYRKPFFKIYPVINNEIKFSEDMEKSFQAYFENIKSNDNKIKELNFSPEAEKLLKEIAKGQEDSRKTMDGSLKKWLDSDLLFNFLINYCNKNYQEKTFIDKLKNSALQIIGFLVTIFVIFLSDYLTRRQGKIDLTSQIEKEKNDLVVDNSKFYLENKIFTPSVRTELYYLLTYEDFSDIKQKLDVRLNQLICLENKLRNISFIKYFLFNGSIITQINKIQTELDFEKSCLEIALDAYALIASMKSKEDFKNYKDSLESKLKNIDEFTDKKNNIKQVKIYVYNLLALINRENKNFTDALDYFIKVLDIDPKQQSALTNLGRMLNKIAMEDDKKQLISVKDQNGNEINFNKLREAAYWFQKEANKNSQYRYNLTTAIGLAISLSELADSTVNISDKNIFLEQAKGYFLEAMEIFDNSPNEVKNKKAFVLNYVTRFLINNGDNQLAKEKLSSYIKNNVLDEEVKTSIYYNYGIALANLGQYDEALQYLKKAKIKIFHSVEKRDMIEEQIKQIENKNGIFTNFICAYFACEKINLKSELYRWHYSNVMVKQVDGKTKFFAKRNTNSKEEKIDMPLPDEILDKLKKFKK